jgi:hypothetical protein
MRPVFDLVNRHILVARGPKRVGKVSVLPLPPRFITVGVEEQQRRQVEAEIVCR